MTVTIPIVIVYFFHDIQAPPRAATGSGPSARDEESAGETKDNKTLSRAPTTTDGDAADAVWTPPSWSVVAARKMWQKIAHKELGTIGRALCELCYEKD